MPQDNDDRLRARNGLIGAIIGFLVIATLVCGGVYVIYREGGFTGLLGWRPGDPLALATRAPSDTPALESTSAAPDVASAQPASTGDQDVPTLAPTSEAISQRTPSKVPTPAPTPTATATPDPLAGTWTIEYQGCVTPGASALKGRVLDVDGRPIIGARIYLTLDEWPYDVPAVTNGEGWYEFYLTTGQVARIDRLLVEGADATPPDAAEHPFEITGECFQHVDLQKH